MLIKHIKKCVSIWAEKCLGFVVGYCSLKALFLFPFSKPFFCHYYYYNDNNVFP